MKFTEGIKPSPMEYTTNISTASIPTDTTPPSKIDWTPYIPFILDQGKFGTCAGFAGAGLKNIMEKKQNDFPSKGLSPLYLYVSAKKIDGIPHIEGTYIRDIMRTLSEKGTDTEVGMPYSLLKDIKYLPLITPTHDQRAWRYRISYNRLVPIGLDTFENCLKYTKQALALAPLTVGVYVTDSFMYPDKDGFVKGMNGYLHGGHAVLLVGADDNMTHTFADGTTERGFYTIQNSWSKSWGDNGLCYMSYKDFHTYRTDIGMPLVMEAWASEDVIVESDNPKYYKVQTGAFGVKDNAINLVTKLKNLGFPTYMPPKDEDGFYRVQVGAFSIKDNAYKLRDQLANAGFKDAFVVYK